MIRPAEYWQAQEAVPGSYVFMEFPELEASGLAKVKSLEPCPAIADGSGNIVTARIVTRQVSELIEIEVAGGETLTGTPMHPIWSVERQDWVELGDLEIGEHLSTDDGPVEIVATRLLATGESVYNLEVHGHHIYQVTKLGLLVHNTYKKALRGYQTKVYKVDGVDLSLTASGMRHILERHVGGYWSGVSKVTQTFLKMNQKEIKSVIGSVLRQNAARVREIGSRGIGQVHGTVNGVHYTVGLNRGRIGQFYQH